MSSIPRMGRADFQVYVESQRVKAGSKLMGAVFLDVKRQISGNSVVVRLVGSEETLVNVEQGDWSKQSSIPKKMRPIVKCAQMATDIVMEWIGGDGVVSNINKRTLTKEASRTVLSVELPIGTQDMIDN